MKRTITNEELIERMEKCRTFFEVLSNELSDTHDIIGLCNHDSSVYLIPKGREDQLTYYGKPVGSFRLSDHWNWFSTLEKCSKAAFVQCCSVDMPSARPRPDEGIPSRPIRGIQVAIFGKDRRYHHIYGEKYDRKTGIWEWVAPENILDVIDKLRS